MTIDDLRFAIERSGLPGNTEIFIGDGMTPLAEARPEYMVLGEGFSAICKDAAEQARFYEQELNRQFAENVRAIRGLILMTEEDVDDDMYDDEEEV